jgi:hypothetical protein
MTRKTKPTHAWPPPSTAPDGRPMWVVDDERHERTQAAADRPRQLESFEERQDDGQA